MPTDLVRGIRKQRFFSRVRAIVFWLPLLLFLLIPNEVLVLEPDTKRRGGVSMSATTTCEAGSYLLGVDRYGNPEGCAMLIDADVANDITVGGE